MKGTKTSFMYDPHYQKLYKTGKYEVWPQDDGSVILIFEKKKRKLPKWMEYIKNKL